MHSQSQPLMRSSRPKAPWPMQTIHPLLPAISRIRPGRELCATTFFILIVENETGSAFPWREPRRTRPRRHGRSDRAVNFRLVLHLGRRRSAGPPAVRSPPPGKLLYKRMAAGLMPKPEHRCRRRVSVRKADDRQSRPQARRKIIIPRAAMPCRQRSRRSRTSKSPTSFPRRRSSSHKVETPTEDHGQFRYCDPIAVH